MAFSKKESATQKFVPVKEVKEGVAILEDNSLRAILMTSTINFSLKSEDERQGILMQFQGLLNTLDFSLQIVAQSRELDIKPYLELLAEQYKIQENELLKIQIREYVDFVKEYTDNVNIMTKSFFVIIPYHPPAISGGKSSRFSFGSSKQDKEVVKQKSFQEHRTQLDQRVSVVEQGLGRTGVRSVRLGDDEIKELFYAVFNPGEEGSNVTQG